MEDFNDEFQPPLPKQAEKSGVKKASNSCMIVKQPSGKIH